MRGTYRGYDIVSMPPPSSGGVELIEMLNILEGYDLAHADQAQELHYLIEAMKRAYADRALFLGDPDKVQNPVARLISKDYAAAWRATIDPAHATPASDIRAGGNADHEGRNTTHFSVVDRFGNAVSNTYTLNFSYGVGLVAEGTGILLNNELDDFAAKPDAPNAYGLLGAEANEPGPGKRPLSSMTPTIVLKDGKPFLVTGSPGGSRIITTVLQIIVDVIDRGMDIARAVSAPRVHNQWMPDQVFAEPALAPDLVAALQARGDKVVAAAALHLGQFDHDHAGRHCRRRRSAHAWRAGDRELASSDRSPAGWSRRTVDASSDDHEPANRDRRQAGDRRVREIPQPAADHRQHHRHAVADGEHAGRGAMHVVRRAEHRRQRQRENKRDRGDEAEKARPEHDPIARHRHHADDAESRERACHAIGPGLLSPAARPGRASGRRPATGRD